MFLITLCQYQFFPILNIIKFNKFKFKFKIHILYPFLPFFTMMQPQRLVKIGSKIGAYGSPIKMIHPGRKYIELVSSGLNKQFIQSLMSNNIWAEEDCGIRRNIAYIRIPKSEHFTTFGTILSEKCSFENQEEHSWFKYVMGISSKEFLDLAEEQMKKTIFEVHSDSLGNGKTLKSVRGKVFDEVTVRSNRIFFTLFKKNGVHSNPRFPPFHVVDVCGQQFGVSFQEKECVNDVKGRVNQNNFLKMIESRCKIAENSQSQFDSLVQKWREQNGFKSNL